MNTRINVDLSVSFYVNFPVLLAFIVYFEIVLALNDYGRTQFFLFTNDTLFTDFNKNKNI